MPRRFRDSAKPRALTQARVSLAMMNGTDGYGSVESFNKNQQFRIKSGTKMLACTCDIRLSEICNQGAYQLDSEGRMMPLCVIKTP